jgi:PTH1 family peptidyl-tRNA hydrolase
MALPPGRIRFRAAGSAGGHNGLDDIAAALATTDIARLRVGIGEPVGPMDARDYVLSAFEDGEKPVMTEAIERAASAVENWIARGGRYVMDHYNPKPTDKNAAKEGGNGQ